MCVCHLCLIYYGVILECKVFKATIKAEGNAETKDRQNGTQAESFALSSLGTKVQWQFTAGQGSGLHVSAELFLYLPMIRFPAQTHQEDSSGCPLLRTG